MNEAYKRYLPERWSSAVSEPVRNRILLVEDETLIAMNEKLQLEKYGYTVGVVSTGEEAVEAVQTSSDIDLILMDVNLGSGIDGTQTAEIILRGHDVPVTYDARRHPRGSGMCARPQFRGSGAVCGSWHELCNPHGKAACAAVRVARSPRDPTGRNGRFP